VWRGARGPCNGVRADATRVDQGGQLFEGDWSPSPQATSSRVISFGSPSAYKPFRTVGGERKITTTAWWPLSISAGLKKKSRHR